MEYAYAAAMGDVITRLAAVVGKHPQHTGALHFYVHVAEHSPDPRKAADIDDELGNDPPLYGGGSRLALAGALLDAGKADEASKEIAEAMRLNGPSAWIHQGLAQLADLRGAREAGQRHAANAREAWKKADGGALPRL